MSTTRNAVDQRVVIDGAREPWTVEEAAGSLAGRTVVRFRHELGYELVATTPRRLVELTDRELVRLLESTRRRRPVSGTQDAA